MTFLFSVNTCLQEGAERFKYMYLCINWALFHLLNLVCYWTRGNTIGINFEWASSFTLIKSCFFWGGGAGGDSINIVRDWYHFHLGLTTLPGKLKNIIRLFLLSRNRYVVMNRLYSRNIHGGNKACIQLYVSSIFFFSNFLFVTETSEKNRHFVFFLELKLNHLRNRKFEILQYRAHMATFSKQLAHETKHL